MTNLKQLLNQLIDLSEAAGFNGFEIVARLQYEAFTGIDKLKAECDELYTDWSRLNSSTIYIDELSKKYPQEELESLTCVGTITNYRLELNNEIVSRYKIVRFILKNIINNYSRNQIKVAIHNFSY